jgi:hypothetical protein
MSVLASVSCNKASKTTDATEPPASSCTQPLAPFSLLERLPAEGLLEARDLAPGPAAGAEQEWTAIEGLLAPEPFWVRSAAAGKGEGDRLANRIRTRTADLKVMEWSIADDGSVLLHAVDSLPDRTTSLFEPALLIAPPKLEAGEERSSNSAMRAVLTATPARERDRGNGERSIRYDRDELLHWRGATHRAKVAVVRFVADLGSARAERVTEIWVIPGEGVVAERWNETLTILRVFDKRSMQFAARR